jgi:hypothetical protein
MNLEGLSDFERNAPPPQPGCPVRTETYAWRKKMYTLLLHDPKLCRGAAAYYEQDPAMLNVHWGDKPPHLITQHMLLWNI